MLDIIITLKMKIKKLIQKKNYKNNFFINFYKIIIVRIIIIYCG